MYLLLLCRTVEVNNIDAEGRLVLGDGVRSFQVFCRCLRGFSHGILSYFGREQNFLKMVLCS